jgi:segregation and condensation protein B
VTNQPTPTAPTNPDTLEDTGLPQEHATTEDWEDEDADHLPPGQTAVPVGDEVVVDDDTMRRALEAILMVTDEPLPVLTLARAVGRPTVDVATTLATLAEEYTEQGRGFDLREVAGGWRYYTRVEAAPYVERFVLDGQQARLTQAALETLAVVAYKQPVSRARVSAIRGVNVDGVMRTLVARGLVEEAGSDTESQAILYRTTSYFLERMGMHSLDDLPELAPYLPEMDDIEDELAAQSLPAAPTTPEDAGTTPTEGDPAPDTANEPATDAVDEAADDVPDDKEPAGAGIDGDLGAGELDVEHHAGELEPGDDVGETGGADELEAPVGADESDDGEPLGADDRGDDESASATDGSGNGIDGDLSGREPQELDLEHEAGELEVADEIEPSEEAAADYSSGGAVADDRDHPPASDAEGARNGG